MGSNPDGAQLVLLYFSTVYIYMTTVHHKHRGVLLMWIIHVAVQGPAALAVAAGGGCLDLSFLFFLSLGCGHIDQNNQPTNKIVPPRNGQ